MLPQSLRSCFPRLPALAKAAFAWLLWGSFCSPAAAQDLEPRAYANTPVGMSFAVLAYGYSTGSIALDASVPLEDAKLDLHTEVFALAHSFALFGNSAKVDAIFPVGELSGTARFNGADVERNVSGLGDQRLRFSYNFYGAPALTVEQHQDWHQDLLVGGSLQVTMPGGQYDVERVVNLGSNRWAFKPEIGVSKAFGDLLVEVDTALSLYTSNDDYLDTHTRKQDPLFAVQVHGIYTLWRGVWAALDATYYTGGQTSVDGVDAHDSQSNLRLGGTVALPVSRHQSIKLYSSGAVLTRTGSEFTAVGIAWQYRWGGGL
jgi:hypothetical protein